MSDAVPPALESGESCISGENIPSPFSDLSKSDKGDRSSFSINEVIQLLLLLTAGILKDIGSY